MKTAQTIQHSQTPLQVIAAQHEEKIGLKFAPDKRFYQKIGINSKRFGQLLRGEKTLNVNEAKSLSEFFRVPVTDLF
ncbi:MAG: hypothetical protein R2822_22070 [Spirosomataceae bacterium]